MFGSFGVGFETERSFSHLLPLPPLDYKQVGSLAYDVNKAINVLKWGHQVLPKLGKPCFFLGPAAFTRQILGSE